MYFRCAVSPLKVSLGDLKFGYDETEQKYGYYVTDSEGADTFHPFNQVITGNKTVSVVYTNEIKSIKHDTGYIGYNGLVNVYAVVTPRNGNYYLNGLTFESYYESDTGRIYVKLHDSANIAYGFYGDVKIKWVLWK